MIRIDKEFKITDRYANLRIRALSVCVVLVLLLILPLSPVSAESVKTKPGSYFATPTADFCTYALSSAHCEIFNFDLPSDDGKVWTDKSVFF